MPDVAHFPRDPILEALREVPSRKLPEPSWSQPRALPPLYPSVPGLPPAMLPAAVRPWLCDIADRTQIPLEFAAVPGIVALGAVIGRTVGLRPKRFDDWTVPGNLWGAIVGPPGVMKTPAIAAATTPLSRLATAARRSHEAALLGKMASDAAEAARREAIKDKMKKAAKAGNSDGIEAAQKDLAALAPPAQVVERRYTTSDATIEKLGELLNENPRGILLLRDELTGFLRGLDRDDRAQDRAFFLEAWNGIGSFTTDRIGRGTVHVEALCLSVLGESSPAGCSPTSWEPWRKVKKQMGCFRGFRCSSGPTISGPGAMSTAGPIPMPGDAQTPFSMPSIPLIPSPSERKPRTSLKGKSHGSVSRPPARMCSFRG